MKSEISYFKILKLQKTINNLMNSFLIAGKPYSEIILLLNLKSSLSNYFLALTKTMDRKLLILYILNSKGSPEQPEKLRTIDHVMKLV